MSQTPPVGTTLLENVPFPIAGPGSDWDFLGAIFTPEFFNPPDADCDYVVHEVYTVNPLDININSFANQLKNEFLAQSEGTLLAVRIFHKEIFDVSVPTQVCVPQSFFGVDIPYVGGACQSIPIVGGQDIGSAHRWQIQVIYHNLLPAVAVIALVLLAIFGIVIALNLISHGKINLIPAVIQTVKDFSPAGEAAAITQIIAVGAGALILAAILFPQLGSQVGNAIRTGTAVSGNVRSGAPVRVPSAPARRR